MGADRSEIRAYARRVETMRAMQRRFFAGERTAAVVSQAKKLEREVDHLTAEILTAGPSLFDAIEADAVPGGAS